MARSPETNQAFLREVDDEVRRDAMTRAARRYGAIVAAAVVIGLLAFAAYLFWQHHREAQAGERGEQFTAALAALSSGNAAKAHGQLDALTATGTPGYAPLARVLLADMAVRDGKDADAAAAFLRVANDTAVPQPLRDLAMVRATTLDFDRLQPAQVIRRVAPLTGAGKPWAGSAGELTALAQMKLGQGRAAGQTLLGVIRDPAVPESLRQRAIQLAGDLGVDAPETPGA